MHSLCSFKAASRLESSPRYFPLTRYIRYAPPFEELTRMNSLAVLIMAVVALSSIPTMQASMASSFYSSLPPLPFIPSKPILIKYGGNAMTSPVLSRAFCDDVRHLANLGVKVIVVHGGGPMITKMLKDLNLESKFDDVTGVRISSPDVVRAAGYALGKVNKDLAACISTGDVTAVGLDGRDGKLLQCVPSEGGRMGDVGDVRRVNAPFLSAILSHSVPIISPVGCGLASDETVYNVNADVAAGVIATEMDCCLTLFLTDIKGVLDGSRNLLSRLTKSDTDRLIKEGVIKGGMIPKVSYALTAASKQGSKAIITDGRVEHSVVKEVYRYCGVDMEGGGTCVTAD